MELLPCCVCDGRRFRRVWAPIARDDFAARLPHAPNPSRWVACLRCGLVFQNPRPDASDMESLYAGGVYRQWDEVPDHFFDYSLVRPQPIIEWLHARLEVQKILSSSPKPSLLDIGSGVGGSLPLLRDRGWDAYGVEPDPHLARAGSERFKMPIAPEWMSEGVFPDVKFDLMMSVHTFEHLLNPLDVARVAARRLREREGLMCVVVPTYVRARHWAWEWMNTAHTFLFWPDFGQPARARRIRDARMALSNAAQPPLSRAFRTMAFGARHRKRSRAARTAVSRTALARSTANARSRPARIVRDSR